MITRPAPVAPAKIRASSHIRRLAKEVQRTFPDMTVHQHLTDAARENDAGRSDNAKRHLDAAIASFAPLQLIRHGIHDDTGHMAAKNFMQQAHRGRLLVQDVQHMQGENDGLMERHRDQAASALQQRAMRNAQPQPVGRVDRGVAAPDAPQQPGSKQFGWGTVLTAIELAATPPHETAGGRRALRAKGQTAYGTSYPVPNVSYWHKAVSSIGRAPAAKRGVLRAFLRKRGRELGIDVAKAAPSLATANPRTGGIELVGPKGYIHGWIKVAGDHMRMFHGGETEHNVNHAPHEALVPHVHARDGSVRTPPSSAYPAYRGMSPEESENFDIAASGFAWGDVLHAIELSAQTGRLATQPHPFGKPGGPGLWNVKGMELPPYIQNIARALLRTGRAKDLSQAIAIAKGATSRWAHGGGHVSPEVRAASTATNASWNAKRATAHAHAGNGGYQIDLAGTAAGAAKDSRTPLGQFGTGGGAAGGQKAPQTRAQKKAALLARAKADRAQAKLLLIRIAADRAALASASGKTTKGQKGAVTKATASTTKSSAPKTASPTSSASTGLSPKQVTAATTAAKAAAGRMNKAQLTAAIKAMTAQEKNLLAAAAAATAQAAKT